MGTFEILILLGINPGSCREEVELENEIKISECDKCTFCFFAPGPTSFCKYYRKGISWSNNGKPEFCNVDSITVNEADA